MSRRVAGRVVRILVAAGLVLIPAAPAYAQQPPQLPDDGQNCLPAPAAPVTTTPWPQEFLGQRRVWELTKGAGVSVAVVDSGVDASTPQLAGRVRPGVDVVSGGQESANEDCLGHGTFVAGLIGAAPFPATGFAGVAPAVTIIPVRIITSLESGEPGSLSPEALASGITAAVDAGADVINVSASTTESIADLAAAVDYAAAQDVVVVASVANNPEQGASVTYPAAYPSVIAVGSIDSSGALSDFSARGDFVDLVAPGKDVVSVGPGGHGHWLGSGSSYAAPFVAGAAALVRAYHPELTAAQVKDRLEVTATAPAAQLPHQGLGWGIVDPLAAVTAVLPSENGIEAVPVEPPSAQPPPDLAVDIGPLLATVCIVGTVAGIFVFGWVARLSGSAHRRRWRRARILRTASAQEKDSS